jgi:hypothetical protein
MEVNASEALLKQQSRDGVELGPRLAYAGRTRLSLVTVKVAVSQSRHMTEGPEWRGTFRLNLMSDEPIFGADEWRTLYRPLPKDVYDAVKQCEDAVGVEIGNLHPDSRSMGQSVAVWSIITFFLIQNIEELKQTAREWTDETPRESESPRE